MNFRTRLMHIEEILLAVLLLIMSIVTFTQVITRYVFFYSLPWSEELTRYLMIWLTFLGGALAIEKGSHIGVDLLVTIIGEGRRVMQSLLSLSVDAVGLAFSAYFAFSAYSLVARTVMFGQVTPAMRLPMACANASLLVGGVLMCVHFAGRCWDQLRVLVGGEQ